MLVFKCIRCKSLVSAEQHPPITHCGLVYDITPSGIRIREENEFTTSSESEKVSLDQVTALIVSFRRFDCLRETIDSIYYLYPSLKILVVDNSGSGKEDNEDYWYCIKHPQVTWIDAEFDAGLARCRNIGISNIDTEYVLYTDDDDALHPSSSIEDAIRVLNETGASLVSGILVKDKMASMWISQIDLNLYNKTREAKDIVEINVLNDKKLLNWLYTEKSRLPYIKSDKYLNIFVARTSMLKKYPWNNRLKISGEHYAHIVTLKQNSVASVYSPVLVSYLVRNSKQTRTDNYLDFRRRKQFSKEWVSNFECISALNFPAIKEHETIDKQSKTKVVVSEASRLKSVKACFSLLGYSTTNDLSTLEEFKDRTTVLLDSSSLLEIDLNKLNKCKPDLLFDKDLINFNKNESSLEKHRLKNIIDWWPWNKQSLDFKVFEEALLE
jgi:glycosyltransferase involved in cell wall biosynthesis